MKDLKSVGFLDNLSYESKERIVIDELVIIKIIKLFSSNYARSIDIISGDCYNGFDESYKSNIILGWISSAIIYKPCY